MATAVPAMAIPSLRRRSRVARAPAPLAPVVLERTRRDCAHDYENAPNGYYVFHEGRMRCDSECDGVYTDSSTIVYLNTFI